MKKEHLPPFRTAEILKKLKDLEIQIAETVGNGGALSRFEVDDVARLREMTGLTYDATNEVWRFADPDYDDDVWEGW